MPISTTNFGLQQPLVNNPTDQDLWGNYLNADLVDVDGLLLTALNWTPILDVTTTITVTAMTSGSANTGSNRTLYLCNATAGAFSANLPAVATASGLTVAFKKTDSSANAITITANASDLIDGAGTYSLASQYAFVVLACDGTAWNIVAQTAPSVSFNNVALTGTPTAPTAAAGTNTTQVATTAFVEAYQPIQNPLQVGAITWAAYNGATNTAITVGSTYAGSALTSGGFGTTGLPTGTPGFSGGGDSLSGTWKALASCIGQGGLYSISLFQRIA